MVRAGTVRKSVRRPSVKNASSVPIPGTSKVKHLEQNTAAALLELDDSIMDELERQPAADETP